MNPAKKEALKLLYFTRALRLLHLTSYAQHDSRYRFRDEVQAGKSEIYAAS